MGRTRAQSEWWQDQLATKSSSARAVGSPHWRAAAGTHRQRDGRGGVAVRGVSHAAQKSGVHPVPK
eukprot:15478124-Alexandrium_andersonii.AAC.1